MNKEESEKYFNEVLETIDCRVSLEDELLKLFLLVCNCVPSLKHEGQEFISREYIKEKVHKVLNGCPIILDSKSKFLFAHRKFNDAMEKDGKDSND